MPKTLTLIVLGAALASTVLLQTGGLGALSFSLLAISAAAIYYWLKTPAFKLCPYADRPLFICVAALIVYCLFQILPLPGFLLRILSPGSNALTAALRPISGVPDRAGTWSLAPSATVVWLARLCAYVLTFLLVRELAWRWRRTPWIVIAPLFTIAFLQGATGLLQQLLSAPGTDSTGSYANRDHFSMLLEMALPFAIMYFAEAGRLGLPGQTGVAVRRTGAVMVSAMLLLAILTSYSRMGFAAAIFSLTGTAGLAIATSRLSVRSKLGIAASTTVLAGMAVLLLAPSRLVARFSAVTPEGVSGDLRPQMWKDSLGLIASNPVFGSGLGSYSDAILQYQKGAMEWAYVYAHSDYVQIAAELGLLGLLLLAGILAIAGVRVVRATRRERTRNLALACAGAMIAVIVHSAADSILYVPPNALAFAWILGLGAALPLPTRPPHPESA